MVYLPVLVLRRESEGHLGDPLSAFLFVFHSVLLPDVAQHEKTTKMTNSHDLLLCTAAHHY